MPFFVYLIVSNLKKNKKISYVGYTNNLKKRLSLHNSGKGAKFTRGKKWKLVYYKKYDSRAIAMKNEFLLKKNYILRKKLKTNK
ncbi:MAG: GIY-YIG nuclease family protein [Pseudomonadota bacterium]|nr:GIY-YIG nuclease family protein [Pseudomonadota bacterium]